MKLMAIAMRPYGSEAISKINVRNMTLSAEFSEMVDSFLNAGFNYFDTVKGYLEGKSETALRECLTKPHLN